MRLIRRGTVIDSSRFDGVGQRARASVRLFGCRAVIGFSSFDGCWYYAVIRVARAIGRIVYLDNLEMFQCVAPSSCMRGYTEKPLTKSRCCVALNNSCFQEAGDSLVRCHSQTRAYVRSAGG